MLWPASGGSALRGTACGRRGGDGLRRYVVHVLIRRRLAAAANDAARAFAKGRLDALGG